MNKTTDELSVSELKADEIKHLVRYWTGNDPDYLTSMGVDINKLPSPDGLQSWLAMQSALPDAQKTAFCLIWNLNEKQVGHCNLNPITFGQEAFLHLHIWDATNRKNGIGIAFLKLSIPVFFQKFKLKKIICEPYALNPAPHKTLEKAGFTLAKEYVTTPGSITFEQPVKRWELSYQDLQNLPG